MPSFAQKAVLDALAVVARESNFGPWASITVIAIARFGENCQRSSSNGATTRVLYALHKQRLVEVKNVGAELYWRLTPPARRQKGDRA